MIQGIIIHKQMIQGIIIHKTNKKSIKLNNKQKHILKKIISSSHNMVLQNIKQIIKHKS